MLHQTLPSHPANGPALVEDRECDACTVCCVVLRIEDVALTKPAGVPCRFLARGCTIHATRPATCRSWMCGWRLQPQLDERWRPDRSGILLIPQMEPTPGFQAIGYTMQLASQAPLKSPEVLNKLCGFIAGNTPIYLSLTTHPTKVLLNPVLAPLIAAGNGAAILAALVRLSTELMAPV